MFRFGYGQYMQRAFPRDDLRPISCRGKDSQGGIALTLIDSLDTLVVCRRCSPGCGWRPVVPCSLEAGWGCGIGCCCLHRSRGPLSLLPFSSVLCGGECASPVWGCITAHVFTPMQVMDEREELRRAVAWLAANATFDVDARVGGWDDRWAGRTRLGAAPGAGAVACLQSVSAMLASPPAPGC